jgi:hypothetical protein
MHVEEAIDAPRVHVEEPHVHCEGGADPAEVDALEARGYDVVRWRRRNLYFGGVAAVEVDQGGVRHAAGDPRRGGTGSWSSERKPSSPSGRSARGRRRAGALAEAVGSEPEGWLLSESGWRSVVGRAPLPRAVRRHPDAAVFVAETDDGIVGRLSALTRPAPVEPARRRSGPDGRCVRLVARASGAPSSNPRSSGRVGRASGSSSSTSSRTTRRRSRCTSRSASSVRGYRKQHFRRGREYVDAILMAYEIR